MRRINVTKTFLPPIEEYKSYVDKIWESGHITNSGPLLKDFEKKAASYLGVSNFQLVSNGTSALQLALNALGIKEGEVVTTPFSYVATTSAILWERCKPVFVDIDPDTYCIDPAKIEAAITKDTKAILAVHVFGIPCDMDEIERIADKHQIKVIYDAAHAFGVEHDNKPLFSRGDITIGSFHATKLFHTIEGGCVVAEDDAVNEKVDLIKRFGHNDDTHITLGINAKASDFQAAMGLCNLKYVESIIQQRKTLYDLYNELLSSRYKKPTIKNNTKYNYSYYPLVFSSEEELQKAVKDLNVEGIYPRRYFYPSLNTLKYLEDYIPCPISEDIAARVLCLPLYSELEESIVEEICGILNK